MADSGTFKIFVITSLVLALTFKDIFLIEQTKDLNGNTENDSPNRKTNDDADFAINNNKDTNTFKKNKNDGGEDDFKFNEDDPSDEDDFDSLKNDDAKFEEQNDDNDDDVEVKKTIPSLKMKTMNTQTIKFLFW
jgi:hypothetical protein